MRIRWCICAIQSNIWSANDQSNDCGNSGPGQIRQYNTVQPSPVTQELISDGPPILKLGKKPLGFLHSDDHCIACVHVFPILTANLDPNCHICADIIFSICP